MPYVSDADFIAMWDQLGPAKLARKLGINQRSAYARRRRIEDRTGVPIVTNSAHGTRVRIEHQARLHIDIKDGVVLVGSDAHIWPGKPSVAMRAFTKFAKELDPKAVIMNGDVLDFPQISRHPPIGHQNLPDVQHEIEAAQEQLHNIELAVKRSCKLLWPLGNHDARFETRLATVAPEFAKLHGHSLKNYFPAWEPCWSVWINNNVVIKHRWKNGVHATHNNTIGSGKTIVTSHLHGAKVTPFTDYNGTRYGVDTGCLASIYATPFTDYLEDNPRNWRSGFAVLTFVDSNLLLPELALVWDEDHIQFRGRLIRV